MYERLSEALGWAGDEAARDALEALREPSPEVLAAGIPAESWRAAIDAMLVRADEIEDANGLEAFAERVEEWPAMVRTFEAVGCKVFRSKDGDHVWKIEGPGVLMTVDLKTAEVEGLDEGPYDYPFGELTRYIPWRVANRLEVMADKARREDLRKNYTWSRDARVWLPKSGNGPPIKGGGVAP